MTNCNICGQQVEKEEESIDCEKCNSKFHKNCTIINDQLEDWTCPRCKIDLNAQEHPRIERARSCHSQQTNHSTSSSSSKAALMLQSIQEEKQLFQNLAREKQKLIEEREKILEKKHQMEHQLILKEQAILRRLNAGEKASNKSDSVNLPVPYVNSRDRVTQWVETSKEQAVMDDPPHQELNLEPKISEQRHVNGTRQITI